MFFRDRPCKRSYKINVRSELRTRVLDDVKNVKVLPTELYIVVNGPINYPAQGNDYNTTEGQV